MVSEDGVFIQHNLLQQFNEFVGKVSSHEGLDSDGDIVGIRGLVQSRLHHLQERGEGEEGERRGRGGKEEEGRGERGRRAEGEVREGEGRGRRDEGDVRIKMLSYCEHYKCCTWSMS